MMIILVFPFTRLVHLVSGFAAPFRYLLGRSGYQIVRSRRSTPLPSRKGPVSAARSTEPPKGAGDSAAKPAEQGT